MAVDSFTEIQSKPIPILEDLPEPSPGKKGWPWTEAPVPLPSAMPDGRPWPKISVVTPSFQQGEFLEETLRSVLLQGYPNLEYIVVDGGSTDESVSIIKKYEPWLACWISEKDSGQSEAVNKGFKRVTGEIIGWLNSDDYYEKGAFGVMASEIDPEAGRFLVTADTRAFNDVTGESVIVKGVAPDLNWLLFHDRLYHRKMFTKAPHQPSTFFHKEILVRVGGLNLKFNFAMDFEYWTRVLFAGFRFHYVPVMASHYRFHPRSKSYDGWEGDWDENVAECREAIETCRRKLSAAAQIRTELWWWKHLFIHKVRSVIDPMEISLGK